MLGLGGVPGTGTPNLSFLSPQQWVASSQKGPRDISELSPGSLFVPSVPWKRQCQILQPRLRGLGIPASGHTLSGHTLAHTRPVIHVFMASEASGPLSHSQARCGNPWTQDPETGHPGEGVTENGRVSGAPRWGLATPFPVLQSY